MKKLTPEEKRCILQKMLDDRKSKKITDIKEEIEILKKRLEYLEKELKSHT